MITDEYKIVIWKMCKVNEENGVWIQSAVAQ